MWARRVQNGMDEWKPLDLTTENMDHEVWSRPFRSLETDAASLQAHFEGPTTTSWMSVSATQKCS